MDWYLSAADAAAAHALRHEIRDYLTRHADPGSDVADAELVVEELLANATAHARGPVWVHLSWTEECPTVVVRDLGPGFRLPAEASAAPVPAQRLTEASDEAVPYPDDDVPDLLAEGGRGLFLVTHLAAALEVAAGRGGGSVVTVELPVRRASSPSIDLRTDASEPLPSLDEASPTGGFGREAFLRALVVQMAQAMERSAGPDVSEHVVAQVGTAVGGQMEREYRAAMDVVGRLSAEQLAECFVRLKHAIDGRFFVVELTDERIVLGNTRCPFGDVVRKSPALCRMTSSVFGGIAANNGDSGASVVLEERIAVGDPGCRVVVYLGDPPETARRFAHRYGAAVTAPENPAAPAS